MKPNLQYLITPVLLATAVAFAAGCATEKSQTELLAKAKISQAQAQQTALAGVPGGTVKSSEVEEEKGSLVWSFDIATPGTKDITEVLVDAVTGHVVATEKETPEQEAKEASAKAKEIADPSWSATLTPADEPLTNVGRNAFCVLEPDYQLVFAGTEDGQPTELTITVLVDTQDIGGVPTRVVEEREVVGGKLVEVSRNFCALGVTTRNLYYFGEDVDVYKGDQVMHEGAWRAGAAGAQHGILMPGSIQIGDRYYQEQAPGVALDRGENVATNAIATTPAGPFKDCLKVKETTPLDAGTEYKFYAPGIGLVQDADLRLVKHGFLRK